MKPDPELDALVRLGGQIDRLEQKARELREELAIRADLYRKRKGGSDSIEDLLQQADEARKESEESRKPHRQRRSKYPEGPPLNRKIMDFLRKQSEPCGYQDVLTEVEAHHQSILNALRDLEKRRLVVRLAPNQWVATDTKGGLKVLKST